MEAVKKDYGGEEEGMSTEKEKSGKAKKSRSKMEGT